MLPLVRAASVAQVDQTGLPANYSGGLTPLAAIFPRGNL